MADGLGEALHNAPIPPAGLQKVKSAEFASAG